MVEVRVLEGVLHYEILVHKIRNGMVRILEGVLHYEILVELLRGQRFPVAKETPRESRVQDQWVLVPGVSYQPQQVPAWWAQKLLGPKLHPH